MEEEEIICIILVIPLTSLARARLRDKEKKVNREKYSKFFSRPFKQTEDRD